MAMKSDDPHLLLRDFVGWVRRRRPIRKDAPINEKTLEFVAQGVEHFLAGKKNPWPKLQGNKPNHAKMWECFYLTNFAEQDAPHKPQHKNEGGAYAAVGVRMNITASAVESHVRNAKKQYSTEEGKIEFALWLSKYKDAQMVCTFPANHPKAIADRKRREAILSGEIDPK